MARISELSLNDDFTRRGRWWLPGKMSDAVAGEVSFSERGIRLNLDGHFATEESQYPEMSLGSRRRAPIILGETIDGDACMLLRSTGVRFVGSDDRIGSFAAEDLLFCGEPFGESEPRVAEVLVHYSHLEDWTAKPMIQTDRGATSNSFNIVVPTDRSEVLKVESSTAIKCLTLWTAVMSEFKPGEVQLKNHAHFELAFAPEQTVRDARRVVGKLADLMTLLMGHVAYVTKIRLLPKSHESHPAVIDLFSSWVRGNATRVRAFEMICPLGKMSFGERNVFAAWFEQAEDLKPVYDLLLSTMRGPQAHIEIDFLNLMQALEVFHRRVHGGQVVDEEKYLLVREAMKRAIPAETDRELTDKLSGILEYGNEPSLKKRLRHLCGTASDECVDSILGVSQDGLASYLQMLVDMRNYRTHYDKKLKRRVKHIADDSIACYNMNRRLQAFMSLLLLKQLGLEESKLVNGLVSQMHLAY